MLKFKVTNIKSVITDEIITVLHEIWHIDVLQWEKENSDITIWKRL